METRGGAWCCSTDRPFSTPRELSVFGYEYLNICFCFDVHRFLSFFTLIFKLSSDTTKCVQYYMKLNSYRIWILANSKALLHNHDFRRKTLKICFHGLFCALCVSFTRFWRHYGSLSRHLMALKLQHYTKFLFVRDPFVRLISAFRNKFGRCVSISGWVDRE